MQLIAILTTKAQTEPVTPPYKAHTRVMGNASEPARRFTRAIVLKASKPARAPVWAPLMPLSNSRRQATLRRGPIAVSARLAFASHGANRKRLRAMMLLVTQETLLQRPRILPVRAGSRV